MKKKPTKEKTYWAVFNKDGTNVERSKGHAPYPEIWMTRIAALEVAVIGQEVRKVKIVEVK